MIFFNNILFSYILNSKFIKLYSIFKYIYFILLDSLFQIWNSDQRAAIGSHSL